MKIQPRKPTLTEMINNLVKDIEKENLLHKNTSDSQKITLLIPKELQEYLKKHE
jgi:hypothetical protein